METLPLGGTTTLDDDSASTSVGSGTLFGAFHDFSSCRKGFPSMGEKRFHEDAIGGIDLYNNVVLNTIGW